MYFNKSNRQTGFDTDGIEAVHESALEMVVHECFMELTDTQAAVPQAFSACYESMQVDNGSNDEKVVVLEGVVGDVFGRIKAFFQKVWTRIKGWWNSVVKYFQSLFSSQEEFLKKFEKELNEKSTTGFTYDAYKYNVSALDAIPGAIKSGTTEVKSAFDEFVKGIGSDTAKYEALNKAEKVAEKKKALDSKINKGRSGGVATYKKELLKDIRDGKTSKKEWKEFGSNSLSDMISFIKGGKERLATIKEAQEEVTEAAQTYSDEVDKFKTAYDREKNSAEHKSNYISLLNKAVEVAKYGLAYQTAGLSVANETTREISSAFSSILRTFLHHKPKKEGMQSTMESTSLIDQFSSYC